VRIQLPLSFLILGCLAMAQASARQDPSLPINPDKPGGPPQSLERSLPQPVDVNKPGGPPTRMMLDPSSVSGMRYGTATKDTTSTAGTGTIASTAGEASDATGATTSGTSGRLARTASSLPAMALIGLLCILAATAVSWLRRTHRA
jgi:hypothetical protein